MKKYIISSLLMFSVLVPVAVFAQVQADTDPNAPVSSCVSINNNLRYKTRDASVNGEVSDLQDFLQSQNYLNSEPTGYFGLLTMQAVKAFQKANGISPTGYVGPVTRAKISILTCGTTTITTTTPLTITNTSLPNAQVGTPYEVVLGLLGGPTGIKNLPTTSFKWSAGTYLPSVYNGSPLPPGLFLITNSNNQTVISGTPSQIGTYDFSLDADYQPTATIDFQHASRHLYLTVGPRETSTCSTSGYDTRTGFRCGCTSNSGFSATTGEYCDGSHPTKLNYPPGCTSTSGFSSTTGEYCDGSHPLQIPSINLFASPTTIQVGQSATIGWTSTNATSCLGPNDVKYSSGPSGSEVVIPTITTTYTVFCYNGTSVNGSIPPSSNQSITIYVNPTVNTCTTSGFDTTTGFRCGCTSTSGFSATTGESCGTTGTNSIFITAPTSQEVLYQGKIYTSTWNIFTSGLAAPQYSTTNYSVYLSNTNTQGTTFLGKALATSKSFTWTVPIIDNSSGNYQLHFVVDSNTTDYATEEWSSPFIIKSISTCSSSGYDTTTGLPCGCTSTSGWSTTTGEPCGNNTTLDPYSDANYSQTSATPLSSSEKTILYQYPSSPCGSLMTQFTVAGSVSVGNGPAYASALSACNPNMPNTSTFRVYSCSNDSYLRGNATFAFQCNSSVLGAKSFHFTQLLKNGSNGNEVVELQKYLGNLGYTLTADGNFGLKTQAALIKFQVENKLKGDGIVGPAVRTLLNS